MDLLRDPALHVEANNSQTAIRWRITWLNNKRSRSTQTHTHTHTHTHKHSVNMADFSASGARTNISLPYSLQPLQHATCTEYVGRDSSVGIGTRYGLDGPGIESRWSARFSAPVQIGPGIHLASCTMDARSLPVVWHRCVALTTHQHLVPRLKKE